MKTEYIIAILAGLLILGVVLYNRSKVVNLDGLGQAASPAAGFGQITENGQYKIDFSQEGNLVKQDEAWVLLYEEEGGPAKTIKLNFVTTSVCDFDKGGSCSEDFFQAGERIKVEGQTTQDGIIVVGLTRI